MPVLEHTTGAQPHVVFLVRHFGRVLVGQREDDRLVVLVPVELQALASLDVRIVALAEAPQCFLAVDHRPTQAARLVIHVERCQIVGVAAAKLGVLFEQPFLDVKAEGFGFVVGVALDGVLAHLGRLSLGEFVHHLVGVEHLVQRLAAILGLLVQEFRRPDFVGLKALGELDVLPQVGTRLARRLDLLPPELGAPLGVTESPLLFHPHGRGQDQIGRHCGHGRIRVGDDNERFRIAPAGVSLFVGVGAGLHVVGRARPVALELAVLERPALRHGVQADLRVDGAVRQLPEFLGVFAMFRIGHHHVRRQAVGEGPDLARSAAGGGLAGQGEWPVARLGDLADQEVHVVDHVIDPGAPRMLVEAHGPEADHLFLRIGIQFGEPLKAIRRHAGEFGHFFQGVFGDEFLELVEVGRPRIVGVVLRLAVRSRIAVEFSVFLQRIVGTQAIANVRLADLEIDVALDEFLIDLAALDDVVADVVEDREVGLRYEHHAVIGEFEAPVLEGRQHVHAHVGLGQAAVGDACP